MFSSTYLLLLLFLLLLVCRGVLGENEFCINTAEELIDFSKIESTGTTYSGTTVFLDGDIDFSGSLSEQFEPIGKSWSYYFQGTFDGQGHTISNLTINSYSVYVGLFGKTKGKIRNVVLDSSCSAVSFFIGSDNVRLGGIVGECNDCTIENTVNMASVAFTGNTTGSSGLLFLGGFVGGFSTSSNDVTVKNCANYGSVMHSGTASYAHIGGIVGFSSGSSTSKINIQNCLNYGTITHNGTSKYLYIGGILGEASSGTNNIENCVSGGKITSNKASYYIGSVVGSVSSSTITHCYWTSDVDCNKAYGSGSPTIDNETKQVELNTATMGKLSSYNSSWDKWFMLHLNDGNINSLNQTSLVVIQKHFPNL